MEANVNAPLDVEAAIERAARLGHAVGTQEWPGLALSPAAFAAHAGPLTVGIADPAWTDLYLAAAICAGVEGAAELFDGSHRSYIEVAAARVESNRAFIDEVTQRVLTIVLVGSNQRAPAINGFSGRGNLRGWLRLIARREAIKLVGDKREQPLEDHALAELLDPAGDPELALVKENAADELRAALLDAIDGLSREERTMLRLSALDGLSIDQIAPLFQLHRATVARRLATIRGEILESTKARLKGTLGIASGDVFSLINAARSRLDFCLEDALVSGEHD